MDMDGHLFRELVYRQKLVDRQLKSVETIKTVV